MISGMRLFMSAMIALVLAGASYAHAANRALLIGLDVYENPKLSFPVKAAAHDVAAMKHILTTKLGYQLGDIKILQDGAATRKAILHEITAWLGAGSKPGDKVLFYYAGHGYYQKDVSGDEKDGLDETLVPYDAIVTGDKAAPLGNMVSDDELNHALGLLKGRHVSVIIDAGHSGSLTRAIVVEARSDKKAALNSPVARAPRLTFATRSIVVEPRLKVQKSEGLLVDKKITKGSLVSWSAVSASQRALIDPSGTPHGVFTQAYVEGVGGLADINKNGTITNAELLAYLTQKSTAYCKVHKAGCEMGLTPRLEPASAYGENVYTGKLVKGKITPDYIKDFLTKGNVHGISVAQIPRSPVYVGAKNIKFRIISPHDGYLVLLNLNNNGELLQLFPNKFSRKHDRDGKIRAHAPLTIPDDYYGIKFSATTASKGVIIALVARQKIDLPKGVKTRSIEVIPRQQVAKTYLPELAASLNRPAHTKSVTTNTAPVDWSVATLKYEIKSEH